MPLLNHCDLDCDIDWSTRAEAATQSTPGSSSRLTKNCWGRGRYKVSCASAQRRHIVTSVAHVERAAWRELPKGWRKCELSP